MKQTNGFMEGDGLTDALVPVANSELQSKGWIQGLGGSVGLWD